MKNFLPSIRGRSKSPKKNRQRTTVSKNYEQADNSSGVAASNIAAPNNTATELAVSPKAYNDELTQREARNLPVVYGYRGQQICWDFLNGRDCRYATCPTDLVKVVEAEEDQEAYKGQIGKLSSKIIALDPGEQYAVFNLTFRIKRKRKGKKKKKSRLSSGDQEEADRQLREKMELSAKLGEEFSGSALQLVRPEKCPHKHTYQSLGSPCDIMLKEHVYELDSNGGIMSDVEREWIQRREEELKQRQKKKSPL